MRREVSIDEVISPVKCLFASALDSDRSDDIPDTESPHRASAIPRSVSIIDLQEYATADTTAQSTAVRASATSVDTNLVQICFFG